jgi:hypothetical protein
MLLIHGRKTLGHAVVILARISAATGEIGALLPEQALLSRRSPTWSRG